AKPELIQNPSTTQVPTEPSVTPAENRSLPTVTYIEVPPQSAVAQKDVAIRMEIIAQSTAGTDSPRSQEFAARTTPFVAAKSASTQPEPRSSAKPELSQPVPQIINVSRQAAVPLE